MTIPIKTSQLNVSDQDKLLAYILTLDNDLKHLYSQFNTLISFKNVIANTVTASNILSITATITNLSSTTYSTGTSAGIDATVTYVDTLLGAKTLTFKKGLLTKQA